VTAVVAWGFAVLALICFTVPALVGWFDRRRVAVPEFAALCVAVEHRRQVRLELGIRRPSSVQDWSVSRIEWLQPAGVTLTAQADDAKGGPILETDLRPRDAKGCWFAGEAGLWAHYPRQNQPAHKARLRITVERPGARARKIVLTSTLPAMDWSGVQAAPLLKTRGWTARNWDDARTPDLI
jgi:hypothetical protein